MKELTTLRKYFEFRQSKGANVSQSLEAIDTIEALLFAQELHAIRADKYRQAAGNLIAAILTNYYTTGHYLGVNHILNYTMDDILQIYVDLQYSRDGIMNSNTVTEVLNAFAQREKDVEENTAHLKQLINEALDKLVA